MQKIMVENWREAARWLLECGVLIGLALVAICGGMVTEAATAEQSETAAYGAVSSLVWALVFAAAVRRLEQEEVYIERWCEK